MKEMTKNLRATIRRAKKICQRDGYPQLVLAENDGSYTITRLYTDCWIYDYQKPIRVIGTNVYFNKQVDIIGYLKRYNVRIVR